MKISEQFGAQTTNKLGYWLPDKQKQQQNNCGFG